MDFVKQLVAFCSAIEANGGILEWYPGGVTDLWIAIVNRPDETSVLAGFSDEARAKYQAWIDKWTGSQPAINQAITLEPVPGTEEETPPEPEPEPEPAPEPEPGTEEEVALCVNCGARLDTDPLTGMPVDRCQACGQSSSKKAEEEAKPAKRRGKREQGDKS